MDSNFYNLSLMLNVPDALVLDANVPVLYCILLGDDPKALPVRLVESPPVRLVEV